MNYPVTTRVDVPDRIGNWRALVHWLLVMPQYWVAAALQLVGLFLAFFSWFIILFTGRMPVGLAKFQLVIIRYNTRVDAYRAFLIDKYPPFDFSWESSDSADYPVAMHMEPELTNRDRVTVFFRLIMMIPALLFWWVIAIVAWLCWLAGFFTVLFAGRWPRGLSRMVVAYLAIGARLSAYIYMLTDKYPPFSLD